MKRMISRRELVSRSPLALAGMVLARPLLSLGADSDFAIPGKDGMIVRSLRFLDLEMPVEYANSFITPVKHFFVRNHMHEPSALDAHEWRLTVSGQVERSLTLTLAELTKMEQHTVINTLECAGNGRALARPQAPGMQWEKVAIRTARC